MVSLVTDDLWRAEEESKCSIKSSISKLRVVIIQKVAYEVVGIKKRLIFKSAQDLGGLLNQISRP